MPTSNATYAYDYRHTEHLDTPRLVADDTQKAVWKWEQQEPFGVNAANEDPDSDTVAFEFNLRFPGQYFDKETGLHQNYFRDGYDAGIGRYTQGDPIGLEGGLSLYLYVNGQPLSLADPLGLIPPPPGTVGGVVGGGGLIGGTIGVIGGRRPAVNDPFGELIQGGRPVIGDPLFDTRTVVQSPTFKCPPGPDCEKRLEEALERCRTVYSGMVMLPIRMMCFYLANVAYKRCKSPGQFSDDGS